MPYLCLNPFATRRALYLSRLPSCFLWILYTHLHPITFLPFCGGTRCQVLFFIKASYSKSIAVFQFLSPKASSTLHGSPVDVRKPYFTVPSVYTFSFRIPSCRRVLGRSEATGWFVAE